jgi:putative NADH-flavin reductase
MKIVVIGGSGLVGSKLVSELRAHGHESSTHVFWTVRPPSTTTTAPVM